MLRLWLLVVLTLAGALAPSRAGARTVETRTWDFFATATNSRSEVAPQVADSRPGFEVCGYELVPGYPQAVENMPAKLYHYTGETNAPSIVNAGLGASGRQVFTTPAGNLSPVQAQIELALPANRGYPGALFEIDTARLQQLGIQPSAGPQRIMSTPTAAGGGVEIIFNQPIPPSAIRQIPFP